MPVADSLPVRPQAHGVRYVTWALAFYAVASLVSMATMSIGAAIAGVAILVGCGGFRGFRDELVAGLRSSWLHRYAWVSVALLAACVLSLIVGRVSPMGWGGKFVEARFAELAKAWYFAWPLILWVGLRKAGVEGRRTVLRAWLVTALALSAMGIVQYFTGWPKAQVIPTLQTRYHAILLLGHHLSVASILIFPFFAALDFLRASRTEGERPILPPAALLATVVLGFVTLMLTYSRTLWVALPVGLALWALRALSRRQLIGTGVAALALVVAATQDADIRTRVLDLSLGLGQRQELWKANLEFLRERPLTGAGFRRNIEASSYYLEAHNPPGAYIFSGHAHNNLIDMLGGTGVLGAVAWLAWCTVAIGVTWVARRRPPRDGFAWGLLCAWLVFQINGLTQVNFWEGKVMHQMMWVLAWSFLWTTETEVPVSA